MALDVRRWLEELGLGEYAERFASNDIDERVLVDLTSDDLKDIGVSSVGHRRRLLGAIARLGGSAGTSDVKSRPDASLATDPLPPVEAERRNLTVMMIDLVGSTELSSRLDPEDLRELLQRYQDAVVAAVVRHEGYVANVIGDGIVAYFGWPKAFEDQAVQGVRAALVAVADVQHIALADGTRLSARVGVASGPVVVGDALGVAGRQAGVISGEAPNLAARLQGLAEVNSVVLSASTHQLTAGGFECRDLGFHALKGFASPMQAYQVIGEAGARSRREARNAGRVTPLVGREEEVAFLRRRWEQVRRGHGQVVLIEGEPGIGKSRLVKAFEDDLVGETPVRVEWRCSPNHQSSSFHPVIEQLRQAIGISRDETTERKLQRLEGMLEAHGMALDENAPALAALLSLAESDRYAAINLDPERLKQKILNVLITWLRTSADRQPVLVIVEDLHWIDPSTLELLGLLVEGLSETRLLQLLTFRSDFHPPWPMLPHLTQLKLNRLARGQVEAMVASIAGQKSLPAEAVRQVVSKTDGVPLFVEELTRVVMEFDPSGATHAGTTSPTSGIMVAGGTIPTSLQDLLMGRLDRLGRAKEVAQLGAVLGREFDYELIETVSPLDPASLQRGLAKLVDAELIYQRGRPPQAHYQFKHALIQDAAYQSLLRSTRQRHHETIARAIESGIAEMVETQPELLAHHYTEAGLAEQALPYWQAAGRRSIQRSANPEAISHLNRGIELLNQLPEKPEKLRRELSLLIAIGGPLRISRGFAAPEVEKAYARALVLCQRENETTDLVPVLRGLWEYYELRAEYRTSRQIAEQLLELAQRTQDRTALLIAHNVLGDNLIWLGEFVAARSHLQQAIDLYDKQQHHDHIQLYGYDAGVACLSFGAWALWFLGYPDQALRMGAEALDLARRVNHPFSFAFALQFAAQLHHYRREIKLAGEQTAEVISVSATLGFPLTISMGAVIRGWALAMEGFGPEGIIEINRGIELWRATGHELERPHFLGVLADAHGVVGDPERGLAALAEARADADRTGERFWDAELHRLQGELALRVAENPTSGATELLSHKVDPEASFLKAIKIARHQQAKSLELRAVMSLSRLWQRQGKVNEAGSLLGQIYGWFTEGFDTPDLLDAKSLLDELRASGLGSRGAA